MVYTGGFLPYSVEDAAAYPYSGGTPGTLVDVAGIFKVDYVIAVKSTTVRGNNAQIGTASSLESADVTMTIHELNLTSLAAIAGGTYATTGTTPSTVNSWSRKSTDVTADYKLAAQTHSKDAVGGGFRMTFGRCQWQSGPDFGLNDEAFAEVQVKATAIPDSTNELVLLEQYETWTALA